MGRASFANFLAPRKLNRSALASPVQGESLDQHGRLLLHERTARGYLYALTESGYLRNAFHYAEPQQTN